MPFETPLRTASPSHCLQLRLPQFVFVISTMSSPTCRSNGSYSERYELQRSEPRTKSGAGRRALGVFFTSIEEGP
jgi:hypothetical protein